MPSGWLRRGVPLWALLLVLVVLPLGTSTAFTVVVSGRAAQDAEDSAAAADLVQVHGRLATSAAAVDQEMLVLVVRAALDDQGARTRLGLDPGAAAGLAGQLDEARTGSRAATDRALDAAGALPAASGVVATTRAQVAVLRADVDAGRAPDLQTLRATWTSVSARLHARQDAVVVAAASSASSLSTVSAVRDVRLVADLDATLAPDVVDHLGWLVAVPEQSAARQWRWLQSHAAVALARDALTSIGDPALRADAVALAGTRAATTMARTLGAAVAGAVGTPTPAVLDATVRAASATSQQTLDVLARAVDVAVAAARADGSRAVVERNGTVVAAGLAALSTLLGVLLIGRRVTRSLRRLADQADEVSQGDLVDVDVAGPREVRSVGRALGAAVGSLRRVQAQAGAVARGDMADPVLAEPLPGPLGVLLHASVEQLVEAIRQRDRLQAALGHEAAHDPLTDLPNRAQALRLTTAALHRARRAGTATGLLFVDLDGFKGVNDRAGHAAGDAVLRTVGARMRGVARAGDTVCRLGGDEFVVLVEAVADVAELVRLGERLVQAVSRPLTVATSAGPRQVAVGASVGVALAQDGEVDGEELLARSDAAVYRAKHAGRGRVEVFDDRLRAHLDERRDVEEALRRGLLDGELHVLYRPVADPGTGSLLGFEVEPRWERPGVGVLTPEAFVPVAEQSDLVCELDRWVLRTAVGQLAAWRTAAGLAVADPGPVVSVDVSARFLGDPRVTDLVLGLLVDAGLPARCLVLEIAEGAVVEAPALLARLTELRALGVRVALDDFGTGPTSLGGLRHLPVDVLKLHGSFCTADPVDQRLVDLVVAAGQASGLAVVAEGAHSTPLTAGDAGARFRAGTASTSGRGMPRG